jgi:hypothetical protein
MTTMGMTITGMKIMLDTATKKPLKKWRKRKSSVPLLKVLSSRPFAMIPTLLWHL